MRRTEIKPTLSEFDEDLTTFDLDSGPTISALRTWLSVRFHALCSTWPRSSANRNIPEHLAMMWMSLLSAASVSPNERLPARRHGSFGLPRQRPSLGLRGPDVPRALRELASASRYSLDVTPLRFHGGRVSLHPRLA